MLAEKAQQGNLPGSLQKTKASFKTVRNRKNPEETFSILVRAVPFLTTRGVLPMFTLIKCAPMKPKPIMSVSFALNFSVHTLLWIPDVYFAYLNDALSFSKKIHTT